MTDWERLRTMTEEEIEANAASDPDTRRARKGSCAMRGPSIRIPRAGR